MKTWYYLPSFQIFNCLLNTTHHLFPRQLPTCHLACTPVLLLVTIFICISSWYPVCIPIHHPVCILICIHTHCLIHLLVHGSVHNFVLDFYWGYFNNPTLILCFAIFRGLTSLIWMQERLVKKLNELITKELTCKIANFIL